MKLKELKELLNNSDEDIEIDLGKKEVEIQAIIPEMATQLPVEGVCANIKHSCNPGDIVAALIATKKYYDVTKRKVNFLQKLNHPGNYYVGATHGTTDEHGSMVCMNQHIYNMIKPLVESQYYINKMDVYEGQKIDLDFDTIRGKVFVNMPQGSIQAWLFYAYPDLYSDISKQWIFLEEQKRQIEEVTKNKVIINFTERYRNSVIMLDYFFLRKYAPDLIFAGTEIEHFKFCSQWSLNIPRLEVKDFLDLAYAIRGAKFLYANQSLCWNISTAIGSPRVLEVCNFAQNCMPFYGDNNVGYFHQAGAEYYFRTMYNSL